MVSRNQNRERDRQIFEGWMADHRGIMVKIVRSFTTNAADADDLMQDIALALWRSVSSFRAEAKPSTWIWRIALNQGISWQRSGQPPNATLDQVADPPSPDRIDDGLVVERIYDAIQTLRPVDRALIVLSLEGYHYDEISDMTGLTPTNVGARLSRARTRITDQMEETV